MRILSKLFSLVLICSSVISVQYSKDPMYDHSRDEFSEEYQKYNKGKQLKWKINNKRN
jgi:hypothetical protein